MNYLFEETFERLSLSPTRIHKKSASGRISSINSSQNVERQPASLHDPSPQDLQITRKIRVNCRGRDDQRASEGLFSIDSPRNVERQPASLHDPSPQDLQITRKIR